MTDLQIDFIRAFGNKELKEGCLIKTVEDYGTIFHYRDISGPGAPEMSDIRARYYVEGDPRIHIWSRGMRKPEILGSEPHLFPDVAKKLGEKGWTMDVSTRTEEVPKAIRIYYGSLYRSYIDISFDPYLPLLEQPQVMEKLLSLTK